MIHEKYPGWLDCIGDEILPSYIGIIINDYKDPVINERGINGKVVRFFFRGSNESIEILIPLPNGHDFMAYKWGVILTTYKSWVGIMIHKYPLYRAYIRISHRGTLVTGYIQLSPEPRVFCKPKHPSTPKPQRLPCGHRFHKTLRSLSLRWGFVWGFFFFV